MDSQETSADNGKVSHFVAFSAVRYRCGAVFLARRTLLVAIAAFFCGPDFTFECTGFRCSPGFGLSARASTVAALVLVAL